MCCKGRNTIEAGVVDTLPSGQCVSVYFHLVSTTHQHNLKYHNYMYTMRIQQNVIIGEGYAYQQVVRNVTVLISGVEISVCVVMLW